MNNIEFDVPQSRETLRNGDFKRIQEKCSLALVLKQHPSPQSTGNTIYTSLLSDGNICKIIVNPLGNVVSFYPVIKWL